MKTYFKILIAIFLQIFIISCNQINLFNTKSSTEYTNEQIAQKITNTIKDNQNSAEYLDWESSENHPSHLFQKFRELEQTHELNVELICSSLSNLNNEDLSLFENEINNPENHFLLKSCSNDLSLKLQNYWQNLKQNVEVKFNFKVQKKFNSTEVIYRDTENGFYTFGGELEDGQVIITFDDGPHRTITQSILESLKIANVRAIFFNVGTNVKNYPNITSEIARYGHAIGSHSFSHKCLPAKESCRKVNGGKILTPSEANSELKLGHQAIYDVLGWIDPFIRLPYGNSSSEIRSFIQQNSNGEFFWNVDSEDWRKEMTPDKIITHVMNQLKEVKRGIILFHDIQQRTAIAMPTFLNVLNENGFRPVIIQSTDPQARFNSKLIEKNIKP